LDGRVEALLPGDPAELSLAPAPRLATPQRREQDPDLAAQLVFEADLREPTKPGEAPIGGEALAEPGAEPQHPDLAASQLAAVLELRRAGAREHVEILGAVGDLAAAPGRDQGRE